MIGMIFERDIHYRVVESKNHGLLQHDPFSWLVKDDHFVDVGDIYESQKIMNEALNEWILSLNEEQVRTFVDTLYQVISASQADDLITFTADWKKSMECGSYRIEGSGRSDSRDAAWDLVRCLR